MFFLFWFISILYFVLVVSVMKNRIQNGHLIIEFGMSISFFLALKMVIFIILFKMATICQFFFKNLLFEKKINSYICYVMVYCNQSNEADIEKSVNDMENKT